MGGHQRLLESVAPAAYHQGHPALHRPAPGATGAVLRGPDRHRAHPGAQGRREGPGLARRRPRGPGLGAPVRKLHRRPAAEDRPDHRRPEALRHHPLGPARRGPGRLRPGGPVLAVAVGFAAGGRPRLAAAFGALCLADLVLLHIAAPALALAASAGVFALVYWGGRAAALACMALALLETPGHALADARIQPGRAVQVAAAQAAALLGRAGGRMGLHLRAHGGETPVRLGPGRQPHLQGTHPPAPPRRAAAAVVRTRSAGGAARRPDLGLRVLATRSCGR